MITFQDKLTLLNNKPLSGKTAWWQTIKNLNKSNFSEHF